MPGVLKRTRDLVDSDNDASGLQIAEERPAKRQATNIPNGDSVPNGYSLANGVGHHSDAPLPPERLPSTIDEFERSGGPPEIEHITQGFLSLSTVAQRAAQETHNALDELVAALADSKTQEEDLNDPELLARSGEDSNVYRKNKLWDFAQVWRSKFIKLLVLSQWTRNAEAVSKIIDINQFIFARKSEYREAIAWMGELKRLLAPQKIPAPDLRTALEVLLTGKATWVSDVGSHLLHVEALFAKCSATAELSSNKTVLT